MSKLIIALYVLTTSAALIILKLGASSGAPVSVIDGRLNFNINPLTVLGVFLYGVSFITYTYLISSYDLGFIIPLSASFVYLIVFLASFFIFKELFTTVKIFGILSILVGLILLNIGSSS